MTSLHRVRCCAGGLTKTYGQGLGPDVSQHTLDAFRMVQGGVSARIAKMMSSIGATHALSPPTSEVAVKGVLDIDGENTKPEGMGHFAE
ncbi:hypothetical protein GCM10007886_06070 [Methylobacterium gregans]|uniref:Uncharacterized protein n=1 Tax=Methylobacterium gregans TaxID=374424 RepID=A0AA37HJN7_9HYPH|nr:hypothetical protein [Methylobacterium gregans]GJD77029.1 hypothetical protein NBEOAGPD_0230 [Methylobacterium gregans]GLS52424.1 hypothetical protein GCM10007886_06070 [Methylobacterium gregans]